MYNYERKLKVATSTAATPLDENSNNTRQEKIAALIPCGARLSRSPEDLLRPVLKLVGLNSTSYRALCILKITI